MKRHSAGVAAGFIAATASARMAAVFALAALLGGCSSLDGLLSGDKVDYRSSSSGARARPLEVPPDLTQLARDNRYAPQGGVISAAATPSQAAAPAAGTPTVALAARGDVRLERLGSQRWLVVGLPPEQLWPQLRAFWLERGFTIASENAEAGVMETDWAENRAKLPQDAIRSTIGRVLGSVYDTGERDRFRTRVERNAAGSEVYISHRGMEEVFVGERKETTAWQARPADPELEAEMLSRLMVRLGTKDDVARTAAAASPAVEGPARARQVGGAGAALEVDEPFDRAWRRVGLALDRSGFTVEDRDRTGGLYFVRYVDPKLAGRDEPGVFSRMLSFFSFGKDSSGPKGPDRYRIAVKGSGEKTQVSVLNGSGSPEAGEAGQRIVGMLVKELR